MDNKTELKPCPFCGGEARLRRSGDLLVIWIVCNSCSCDGPYATSNDLAVEKWNTRTNKD